MIRRLLPLLSLILLTGCGKAVQEAPVTVSVIGDSTAIANPNRGRLPYAQRVLLDATAQGLVRLDAAGQIQPALAERWIMIDDGKSWIFRLKEANWPDGSPVTAGDVAAVLNRARAPGSQNPLRDYLSNVEEVVAMTPEIVEIRLRRPVPTLLSLLTSTDLVIVRQRSLSGTGPYRVVSRKPGQLTLQRIVDDDSDQDGTDTPKKKEEITLNVESATRAIARFKLGRIDLVEGGTFVDWPFLAVAGVTQPNIKVDPADGLFGFAVVGRKGFLSDATNRAAIAMAIDRAGLTAAVKPDWTPVEALLPGQLDMSAGPATPDWSALGLDDRRKRAQSIISRWHSRNPKPIVVRVALPKGPGAVRLWNKLYQDLRAVGLSPRHVDMDEDADLRLIDRVAPIDSARWYLTIACRKCSTDTIALIDAARDAPTLDARSQRLAQADAQLAKEAAFIPIARPLRWSLVGNRLDGWQGNSRARHPLNLLRNDNR